MWFEYLRLPRQATFYPSRGRIGNYPRKGFSGLPLPTGAELVRALGSDRTEDEGCGARNPACGQSCGGRRQQSGR